MEELIIRTEDLVNFSDAARMLKVSRPTVYNLIKKQRLHIVEFAHNRYLLRTEVEGLVKTQAKAE